MSCRRSFCFVTAILLWPYLAFAAGFRILDVKPTFQSNERMGYFINYDYDDSPARLVFSAVSKDGSVRSYSPTVAPLTRGKNQRTDFFLMRPSGDSEQSTELIYIAAVSEKGQAISNTQALPIRWPAVTTNNDPNTAQRHKAEGAWVNDAAACWLTYDFDCLEAAFKRGQDDNLKNAYGISELASLNDMLRRWMHPDYETVELSKLKQWKTKFPGSSSQAMAEAIYWQQAADFVGGCQECRRSDPYAIKLSNENRGKAKQVLLSVPTKSRSPLWHVLYLQTLGAQPGSANDTEKAFKAAQKLYPSQNSIYVAMAKNYLMNYSQVGETVEKLAQQSAAAAETPSDTKAGALQYAQFYVALSHENSAVITEQTAVAWPQMKVGLIEAAKRYPSSHSNNVAAIWACGVNDASMYREFRPRIDRQIIYDLWPENQSPDLCDQRFSYVPGKHA